ncbi:MAG TPA: proton-conducting transporter membrane subunit [Thermohalobaculum sp.]|nr:proton-conducting transporter membrane subunit [Thermohalobaculum sp.]
MTSETLMALALVLPWLGAVGIWLTGSAPNLREAVTLTTAVLTWLCVLPLLLRVLDGARPEVAYFEIFSGIGFGFALEPLGMVFATVASTLWIVSSVYSIGYMRGNDEPRQTPFYVCFAIAIGAALGTSFAANLLVLFLFYEILTISTYPLVAHKGTEEAQQGGRVYLLLLLGTSMLLFLPAIVWTAVAAGTTDFTPGGILAGSGLGATALGVLYTVFIFGIGKAAVMPVHAWLPAAMVAPTPVSALLHAVAVVKAGVFTVVKVTVYIFGLDLLAETGASSFIAYVAGATVVIASLIALSHDNFKKRLAFSTVSQLSYVVMAAAIATPAAIIGATFHIAAHAVSKITLFFAAGSIYTAAHLTEVSELDGIGRRMPITLFAYTVGALSIIGLPPLVGLWSKWWIGVGAADAGQFWVLAVLMISSLLNVAYLLPIVSRGYFAAPRDSGHGHGDEHGHGDGHGGHDGIAEAPATCVIAICTTAALCLALFLGANHVEALLVQIPEVPGETVTGSVEGGSDVE